MLTGRNNQGAGDGPAPAVTAHLLFQRAHRLANDSALPDAVRYLGRLAGEMVTVFVRLPAALAAADDRAAAALLAEHRADLDFYLHAPLEETLLTPLAEAVEAEPRLAPLVPELLRLSETLRSHALAALRRRGIERLVVTPGSPFAPGEVVPSDEQPLAAPSRDLHARVARVTPGRGGYRLKSRVVVPAEARAYHCPDRLEAASEAAS